MTTTEAREVILTRLSLVVDPAESQAIIEGLVEILLQDVKTRQELQQERRDQIAEQQERIAIYDDVDCVVDGVQDAAIEGRWKSTTSDHADHIEKLL